MRSFLPSRKSRRHCRRGHSRAAVPAELTGSPPSGACRESAIEAPGRAVHGKGSQQRRSAAKPTEGVPGEAAGPSAGEAPCAGEPSAEADALTAGTGH